MKSFIKPLFAIFVTSCAINTQSLNNQPKCNCDIIYGRIGDWENISDDLARNIYEHNLNCEKNVVEY